MAELEPFKSHSIEAMLKASMIFLTKLIDLMFFWNSLKSDTDCYATPFTI